MFEKPSQLFGTVVGNRPVAPLHYCLTIALPAGFATPVPGQFVMLRETDRSDPLLSRPLSIFGFKQLNGGAILDLLYRIAGRGTSLLAKLSEGSPLTVLGPLGRGFSIAPESKRVIFVAGGVGVAPLVFLLRAGILSQAENLPSRHFYLGARSADLLAGLEQLGGVCELDLCTDDGSRGHRGLVTDLLQHDLPTDSGADLETTIYACGPMPMLGALSHLLAGRHIPCQISLEERMACGLGACLGCAVETFGPAGEKSYKRVCHDGPVFALREIFPSPPSGQGRRQTP